MLVLKDQKQGFSHPLMHKCPETGEEISCSNFSGLIYKVRQHRINRKLPIPLEFFRIMQHNWCLDHPEQCVEDGKGGGEAQPMVSPYVAYPKLTDQIKSFLADTAKWVTEGLKLSDRDLVAKRLGICIQCPHWNGGNSFINFRCRKCGCCTRIKVHRPRAMCPDNPPRW